MNTEKKMMPHAVLIGEDCQGIDALLDDLTAMSVALKAALLQVELRRKRLSAYVDKRNQKKGG